MPFVNGRYYMNPRYGAAIERGRQSNSDAFDAIVKSLETGSTRSLLEEILRGGVESSVQPAGPNGSSSTPRIVPVAAQATTSPNQQHAQPRASTQDSSQRDVRGDSDGHWVTIDHRHVFIRESSGDGHDQRRQAAQQNEEKRNDIANIAKEYNHSTAWAFDKKKDDFPAGSNKCNKYVYDVTTEAGARPIVIGKDGKPVLGEDGKPRPPLAGEWADPNTKIANWRVLQPGETPQPGDVAAYKLQHEPGHAPYTGHSGIVTSVDSNGTVHAIAAHDEVVGPDDSFQPRNMEHHVVFRRYTGG